MQVQEYYSETDSAYLKISNKKAYSTVEVNSNILIDVTQNRHVVGIEIVGLSRLLSRLIAQKIVPAEISKTLKMHFREEEEMIIDFEVAGRQCVYAIPKEYASPVLESDEM